MSINFTINILPSSFLSLLILSLPAPHCAPGSALCHEHVFEHRRITLEKLLGESSGIRLLMRCHHLYGNSCVAFRFSSFYCSMERYTVMGMGRSLWTHICSGLLQLPTRSKAQTSSHILEK